MVLLRYWDDVDGWVPAGVRPRPEDHVPVTGGTVHGPLPLMVAGGVTVLGVLRGGGITGTLDGFIDMNLAPGPDRFVSFGGSEVQGAGVPVLDSDAATKRTVDDAVRGRVDAAVILGSSWAAGAPYRAMSSGAFVYPQPSARRDGDGAVSLNGIVTATAPVAVGGDQWIMRLPDGFAPEYRVSFATSTTADVSTFLQVDIDTDGYVWCGDTTAAITPGIELPLDGICFYAAEPPGRRLLNGVA